MSNPKTAEEMWNDPEFVAARDFLFGPPVYVEGKGWGRNIPSQEELQRRLAEYKRFRNRMRRQPIDEEREG